MSDGTPPPHVRVLDASELDVAAHAALQQRVFGSVLEENGIPLARLGADVFAWKLNPPQGEGRVAVVERDGAMLSTCSAFPVELGAGERRVRGWHLCDAATAPEARGSGFFHAVHTALRESVPADDLVFAFPNGQSRGAFVRDGYETAVEVPLWFRPVIGGVAQGEGVESIESFGEEHDELAERLAQDGVIATLRSAEYLTWRYLRHPYFRYQLFELRRDDRVDGVLVLNRMEARGRTSMWVMELVAVDKSAERALARTARSLAKEQDCDVVLSMANARLPGAVRLPACFLPKKHVLMVRTAGAPREVSAWDAWTVQTGDWDTF